jgi:hypothetical protein
MASDEWQMFFPFKNDDKFSIDGQNSYSGEGRVLKRDATTLEFSVEVSQLLLPGFECRILIEYRQEGAGNRVRIKQYGKAAMDNVDAEIESDSETKTRKINTGRYGIKLSKVGAGKAKLHVRDGERTIRLKLEKC